MDMARLTPSFGHSRQRAKLRRSERAATLCQPQEIERTAAVGCKERVRASGSYQTQIAHNDSRPKPTASPLAKLLHHRRKGSKRRPNNQRKYTTSCELLNQTATKLTTGASAGC